MESPIKHDWVTGAIKDLEKINLNLELIEIENMSEESFKNDCKYEIRKVAFEYLVAKQNNMQTKRRSILYIFRNGSIFARI